MGMIGRLCKLRADDDWVVKKVLIKLAERLGVPVEEHLAAEFWGHEKTWHWDKPTPADLSRERRRRGISPRDALPGLVGPASLLSLVSFSGVQVLPFVGTVVASGGSLQA